MMVGDNMTNETEDEDICPDCENPAKDCFCWEVDDDEEGNEDE